MKAYLVFFSFVSIAAWAQRALAPPQVGLILDGHGEIHIVNGLAGNFLLRSAVASGIVSAAYSGSFGLLKSDSALTVINSEGRPVASIAATQGPALFAFSSSGSPALAYFEQSKTLYLWNGGAFRPGPVINQDILSIASLNSTEAVLIVQREGGLWELGIDIATGAIRSQTALPGISAPVMIPASGGVVYRDAEGVVVRREDGSEKHISVHLPASLAFNQMGDGWIEITDLATGRLFGVNIQPGHERSYLLPEVRP